MIVIDDVETAVKFVFLFIGASVMTLLLYRHAQDVIDANDKLHDSMLVILFIFKI